MGIAGAGRTRPGTSRLGVHTKTAEKAEVANMSATLETRVEALEQEVTGIKTMLGGQRVKDWRRTFGMSRNDPAFEELVRLGHEIRGQQKEGGTPGVGS